MLRLVIILVLIWSCEPLLAETSKPISLSYENLIRCFPELANDKLSLKVDLNLVKEISDEKFVTTQSQLRQRKIQFRDGNGVLFNLILRTNFLAADKMESVLTIQKIDEKGIVSEQKVPDGHRINPKPEHINSYLVGGVVKSDEYSYIDTKLNGVSSFYRRNFKSIEEFGLADSWKKRSISCEKKSDFGTICTCKKK